jgi:hypothetical protein
MWSREIPPEIPEAFRAIHKTKKILRFGKMSKGIYY